MEEDPWDDYDNDFDGLINENFEAHFNQRVNPPANLGIEPKPALSYIDYFTNIGIDEPLIDEGRFDGIDNDGDWDPTTDDVGTDGAIGTGDFGEGDGMPTAGEPHFDQTDVDESDQIGLTSFDYFSPPGSLRMNNDIQLWSRLQPGIFDVIPGISEDGDFAYGAGLFPVPSKDTQWFSFSLVFGEDFNDILNNKITVQTIYNENYNFARPPDKPRLTAVPGDGRVTLYWDSEAEATFDPVSGYDFEGYKIYRSTDPNFNEINTITDGFGRKLFYQPLAVYDLYNEHYGFFGIDFQGAQYFLGENNGLRHSYIDSTVTNGITYYYAVTAYDHGDAEKAIFPAETTKSILRDQTGKVTLDVNTAMVTPNPPVLGYQGPAGAETLEHTSGRATGDVYLTLLDPFVIPDNHTYKIAFEDTSWFTRKTLSYSVIDVTNSSEPDTVVNKSDRLIGEADMFDGMRLTFRNDSRILINPAESGWLNPDVTKRYPTYSLTQPDICNDHVYTGKETAFDYMIVVYSTTAEMPTPRQSVPLSYNCFPFPVNMPSKPLNFEVKNLLTGDYVDVGYLDADNNNRLTARDELYFLEFNQDYPENEDPELTWRLTLRGTGEIYVPGTGDTLMLSTFKPFNRDDVYTFTIQGAKVLDNIKESELDKVHVVPNPYVAVAEWEQNDPFRTGRGDRHINFVNVPLGATIRIYTVRGELVTTLKQDGSKFDGTISWNLRTKDNLDAAYGIYVYHIDAPGIGEKVDKFALIK